MGPRVERFHPALLGDEELEVAVVIDVLRATTTAVALLARGADAVRVVATPAALAALPPAPRARRYLVFSELAASRDFGLECVDNSPLLAETLPIEDRCPVLVTTNGTRALTAAMARARTVYAAGFVNLASTVRRLAGAGRIALLPAGDFEGREQRTEDERCADAFERLLAGADPDLPALLADCRSDPRVMRRVARHPELLHDIDIALSVDRHDAVAAAVVGAAGQDGGAAGLELVRAAPTRSLG